MSRMYTGYILPAIHLANVKAQIILLLEEEVISRGCQEPMTNSCNYDEADTRMLVHLTDAIRKGATNIMIRTVDTDVVVITMGQFHDIVEE